MTMNTTILDRIRARREGAGGRVPIPTPAPSQAVGELRAQRDALAERVAELHWDLGGMTYEMAIRDHFRLDVLVRHAAILQEADAELGEVERLLAMEETATTGTCRSCGALHSRGAVYCWKCGQALMLQVTPSAAPAP
jgi:ribosomal protein L40E